MRWALALLPVIALACKGEDSVVAYAPTNAMDRDGGTRPPRPGSSSSSGSSSGSDADGGSEPGGDDAGPATSVLPDTMLAVVTVTTADGNRCALQSVSPGPSARTATFDCEHHDHGFRRSDGERFYVSGGSVFQAGAGPSGTDKLVPTQCDVVGHVDFDAEDRMHYRCSGGTTAALYRDDELVVDGEVAELGGALDDGRIFYHGFEEYRVLDASGTEIDQLEPPPGFTALEEATTIFGDEAFMLHAGEDESGLTVYMVTKYGADGFVELWRLPAVEPPPSNFGRGHRLDPTGVLYVALDNRVRRYDPEGGSDIVWTGSASVTLDQFDELVFFAGR